MFVLVGHLNDDTGILGKEQLDQVVLAKFVETDFHTAFGIGKTHFEQAGDKTTGRNVVTGQEQTAFDELLHRVKGVTEILGVGHRRDVAAHPVERLGKS